MVTNDILYDLTLEAQDFILEHKKLDDAWASTMASLTARALIDLDASIIEELQDVVRRLASLNIRVTQEEGRESEASPYNAAVFSTFVSVADSAASIVKPRKYGQTLKADSLEKQILSKLGSRPTARETLEEAINAPAEALDEVLVLLTMKNMITRRSFGRKETYTATLTGLEVLSQPYKA